MFYMFFMFVLPVGLLSCRFAGLSSWRSKHFEIADEVPELRDVSSLRKEAPELLKSIV